MTVKETIKGIGRIVAPQLTTELLSWRSQRLIIKNEQASGRLDASRAFCERYGSIVRRGPFAGMRYPQFSVSSRNLIPKIVASYEDELHDWIEEAIKKEYPTIVNVGSADGYYSVGLAMRNPTSQVIAFDTDPWARKATAALALENNVSNIEVRSMCRTNWIQSSLPSGSLMLIDCEGFEIELLDVERAPRVLNSDVIVELHEHVVRGVGAKIRDRFSATHDVQMIQSRTKNPDDYPELESVANTMRARSISEGRNVTQWWSYLTRKIAI